MRYDLFVDHAGIHSEESEINARGMNQDRRPKCKNRMIHHLSKNLKLNPSLVRRHSEVSQEPQMVCIIPITAIRTILRGLRGEALLLTEIVDHQVTPVTISQATQGGRALRLRALSISPHQSSRRGSINTNDYNSNDKVEHGFEVATVHPVLVMERDLVVNPIPEGFAPRSWADLPSKGIIEVSQVKIVA